MDHYEIVSYRSDWNAEFIAIATRLRAALGPLALRIDHIGSTAVPNLCAKDVVDLQVTVSDVHNPAIIPAVTTAGFEWRPKVTRDHAPPGTTAPTADWDKLFFREAPGMRRANLHVRAAGKPNQRYALLFRDYLRAHPASAAAYGQVKERLAPKLERMDYVDAKDPVCDLILQAAEMWAETCWTPGPSDA